MSSLPGLDLESFLMWNYDLIVDGDGSANFSVSMAEALGNVPPRRQITSAEFAPIVALHEPYRERVERLLSDFDEDYQSWRQYASEEFYFLPNDLAQKSLAMIGSPARQGVV